MTKTGAILGYAKFMRENYAIILIATLLIALVVVPDAIGYRITKSLIR